MACLYSGTGHPLDTTSWLLYRWSAYTVEPVYSGHPLDNQLAVIQRWPASDFIILILYQIILAPRLNPIGYDLVSHMKNSLP